MPNPDPGPTLTFDGEASDWLANALQHLAVRIETTDGRTIEAQVDGASDASGWYAIAYREWNEDKGEGDGPQRVIPWPNVRNVHVY